MSLKVAITLNSVWNLTNFRIGLLKSLINSNYRVIIIAPTDSSSHILKNLSCKYIPIKIDKKGKNFFYDLRLLFDYFKIFRKEKPDLCLSFTIKPNIYSSYIAHLLNIPIINNVSGLGSVFIKKNWTTSLVKFMYKIAFYKSKCVFFQNNDDFNYFIKKKLVKKNISYKIPGSGVNLDYFKPDFQDNQNKKNKNFNFLLISRILWDKGIDEYIKAARNLKLKYANVDFCLLGFLEVENPTAISKDQVNLWINEGVIKYLGSTEDVRPFISATDCVVLPSYREGLPRSLLEAAAMQKPLVATDTPGCREVVEEGINGFLCKIRDPIDLERNMEKIINLSPEKYNEMCLNSRKKIKNNFDEQIVIERYKDSIKKIFRLNKNEN